METKFMRILVALGVPGVALGIFYLLLKSFHFQFSQVDAAWTAAIVIIFLLLVGGITLFALHRWSPIKHTQYPVLKTDDIPANNLTQNASGVDSRVGESVSTLTVKKIIDEIHNAAPYQRDDIEKHYRGIRVQWEGVLWKVERSAFGLTGETVEVNLQPEPKNWHYGIYFVASVNKYPQLKVARQGDLIRVTGRITDCSGEGMYVRLDTDEINFSENS